MPAPYVSTGDLPPAEYVRALVTEAHERLAAPPVANTRGLSADAGDVDVPFSIMSVAKPFVFALMCAIHTPSGVVQFVGLNATGRRFDSVAAIEDKPDGRTQSTGQSRGHRDDEHDPSNSINRAIGDLLRSYGRLATDTKGTGDLHTQRWCWTTPRRADMLDENVGRDPPSTTSPG